MSAVGYRINLKVDGKGIVSRGRSAWVSLLQKDEDTQLAHVGGAYDLVYVFTRTVLFATGTERIMIRHVGVCILDS